MGKKVILDVDTGHDDALAILLAGRHCALDLQAITVVAGNQVLKKTVDNTISVCSLAQIDVPVYPGMEKPLIRDQVISKDIHGESGLGGALFSTPIREPKQQHAVDFLIDACKSSAGDLTLIPMGPLTNIAMALLREPIIKEGIKEIVLMGGAYGLGNFTPAAEFNIFADPEAAKIVFESGVPITMIGLELTHQAKIPPEVVEEVATLGTPISDLVVELLGHYGEAYMKVMGFEAPPLHDVCAVAYAIDSTLMNTKEMHVAVETTPGLCYGRTVCDYYRVTGKTPNAKVALTLDTGRFWRLFVDTLKGANMAEER